MDFIAFSYYKSCVIGADEMRKRYGFVYVDRDNGGDGTSERINKDSSSTIGMPCVAGAFRYSPRTSCARAWHFMAFIKCVTLRQTSCNSVFASRCLPAVL